ncbi:MAG: AMP-binding protein, partial [Tsuneonella sp.]
MPVALDPRPRPLDHLAERGEGDAPALVLRGRTLNHQDLRTRVGQLAAWLVGRARPGERIASWAAKGEATCILPLACARAGMVHVPINPLLKRLQVAHIIGDSGAALLVGNRARLAGLENGDIPIGCSVVAEEELWAEVDTLDPIGPSDRNPDEIAAILYTSGSTGKPKGVVLSHANMWLGAVSVAHYLDMESDDVTLAVLPLSFDYGQNQ